MKTFFKNLFQMLAWNIAPGVVRWYNFRQISRRLGVTSRHHDIRGWGLGVTH